MKIFLSWSGPVSHDVAVLLKRWLRTVIQATNPWMSEEDIAPGSLWFSAISDEISDSNYGVICVTKENLSAPWLLWEAGALYRGFNDTQLVVPLLINVDKADLGPPLNHFQVIDATDKADVTRMLKGINSNKVLAHPISEEILETQINHYWQELQNGIAEAIEAHHPAVKDLSTGNVRTFREAADRFLDEQKGGPSFVRDRHALRRVGPYINNLPLNKITNSALAQFKEDRVHGGIPQPKDGRRIKPAMIGTVNKELRTVATILNRAVNDWGWLKFAPTIRHLSGAVKRQHILTWAEQEQIKACVPEYMWAAAEFALNTGLRRSEIRDLRWDQERPYTERDTSYFVVRLGHKYNKVVVLNSTAKEIIEKQRGKNVEYVFTAKNGGQFKNFGDNSWLKAWIKAKLPSDKMTLKGVENLRLTFGHRLRGAGVLQEDIDMLMGSTKAHVLQRYSQPDISNLIDCVEKIVERKEITIVRPA